MEEKGYNNLNLPYRRGASPKIKNLKWATKTFRRNKPIVFIKL